ncbi:MAG TPA: YihY family inner membrane protein [Polyangia bacterium]|jgi:membrane protein
MREHLRKLRSYMSDADLASEQGKAMAWPLYLWRLVGHVWRQWARDRCPSQASALSFETALSLVPSLAVAFALLKATGALEARSALVEFISTNLFPVFGERISVFLVQFSDNINAGVLGGLGTGFTLGIAYFVFHELEHTLNDIWRVTARRSLVNKFVIFYTLITLVPMLIGLSLYHTAHYWKSGRGVVGWVLPILLVWVALTLANRLLPRARVQWRSAAIGALVSAILFEAMKRGFALYLSDIVFRRYTNIYGALALLPLLLMWIYATWVVVLLGSEVTYAVQNLHSLEVLERRRRGNGPEDHVNGVVAARVLYAIGRAFRAGQKTTTKLSLAERFEVPQEVIIGVIERLKRADLVLEVEGDVSGYMLARPPEEITIEQAFEPFQAADVRPGTEAAEKLNQVLREIEAARRGMTESVTFADLLAAEAQDAPRPGASHSAA